MDKKKRKFLKAGAILAIIASVCAIVTGVGAILIKNQVNETNALEIIKYSNDLEYQETEDGYVVIYTDEEGVKVTINQDQFVYLVSKMQNKVEDYGMQSLADGIPTLIIAIILLVKTNKNKYSKGLTITLLILSLFGRNMLTFAFMIVALCLKDAPKATLENIEEIKNETDVEY